MKDKEMCKEEKMIQFMDKNHDVIDKEFRAKTEKYSREELLKILEEVCHNFGGIFHYLDEKGRSLPETQEEATINNHRMKPLTLLLKLDKFHNFFTRTMPEAYSANHVGEEAHCNNTLGEEIEEAMDFRFWRNDIL